MNALLVRYLLDLLSKRHYKLIPFYTCRLSLASRRQVCCALLADLTKHGDQGAKQAAFEDMDSWFHEWRLHELGDVQPDELEAITGSVSPCNKPPGQIHLQRNPVKNPAMCASAHLADMIRDQPTVPTCLSNIGSTICD